MSDTLAIFSQSLSRIAASAKARLCAIRTGPNRHISGLLCEGNLIVTCDQALPAFDRYSIVLPNGAVAASRPGERNPGVNLALLPLEADWQVANPPIAESPVGALAIVIGADSDASPVVRLTVVHRLLRTAYGLAPILDMSAERIDAGSLVVDAEGSLIGLAAVGPNGEAMVIPSTVIGQMLIQGQAVGKALPPAFPALAPSPSPPPVVSPIVSGKRAWLGVALQPITVPDALAARAGQGSGRMVVSVTRGGPAEMAGLRVGDVLLALNGTSASGPQALRAFLAPERIGSTIEIKLLRDGNVVTTHMTVASQPG